VEYEYILVALIALAACFTQSVSGFGSALVAMPLLSPLLGLKEAAPLMAVVAMTLQVVLLVYYRRSLNIPAVWRLAAASLLGIPIGIFALRRVDERFTAGALGVLLVVYALYAFTHPRMPRLHRPAWPFLAGFLAGVLGGAYNTNGPPAVVYGDCRRWSPDEFKSNLQGFFMSNNILIVVGHGLCGNLTFDIWRRYLAALPGVVVGTVAGLLLAKRINPPLFRKVMLGMVLLLGGRLLYQAVSGG
jgi:uncharacterized membrane protein YfcA